MPIATRPQIPGSRFDPYNGTAFRESAQDLNGIREGFREYGPEDRAVVVGSAQRVVGDAVRRFVENVVLPKRRRD